MENISLDLTLEEVIKELDDKNLLYMTSGKIKELSILFSNSFNIRYSHSFF